MAKPTNPERHAPRRAQGRRRSRRRPACCRSRSRRPRSTAASFFTPEEFTMVDELSELIIPTDEHSPGARAAQVAAFIDQQLHETVEDELRSQWRDGPEARSMRSREADARRRLSCRASPEQRVAVLERIAENEENPETPEEQFLRRAEIAHYLRLLHFENRHPRRRSSTRAMCIRKSSPDMTPSRWITSEGLGCNWRSGLFQANGLARLKSCPIKRQGHRLLTRAARFGFVRSALLRIIAPQVQILKVLPGDAEDIEVAVAVKIR